MRYVLIIGAKSDIARATAMEYAGHGYDLYLAARNAKELDAFAMEIRKRYNNNVECLELDILDFESHKPFYENLNIAPEGAISFVGYLSDQKIAQHEFVEAEKIIDTNFTGIVSLLNVVSDDFEKRKSGFIVGISSVAGDRGRKSNYIYGSSKAALTAYLSGLRNRLYKANVHVLTVKPGFVNTKMNKGRDLPESLTDQPEEIARNILKAQEKKANVLYAKWIWRWIMLVIKIIPEFQWKKMNLQ